MLHNTPWLEGSALLTPHLLVFFVDIICSWHLQHAEFPWQLRLRSHQWLTCWLPFSASNSATQCQASAFLPDSLSSTALMLLKPVTNTWGLSHSTRIDYQHLVRHWPLCITASGGGVCDPEQILPGRFHLNQTVFFPSQLQLVSQPPLITSIVLVQRRFLFRCGLWLITASSWRRKTRKHRFSTQDIIGTALSESLLAFKISWAGPIFFFISFNTLIFQAPTEQPSKSVELNTQ